MCHLAQDGHTGATENLSIKKILVRLVSILKKASPQPSPWRGGKT